MDQVGVEDSIEGEVMDTEVDLKATEEGLKVLSGLAKYSKSGVISANRFSKLNMSTENLWASVEAAPNSCALSLRNVW